MSLPYIDFPLKDDQSSPSKEKVVIPYYIYMQNFNPPSLIHYHILLSALILGFIAILIVVLNIPNSAFWVLLIFLIYATGVVVDTWVHHFYH
ncbi:MAG: hypothetical protein QXI16_03220 [Sulfolobaceae archaeon]